MTKKYIITADMDLRPLDRAAARMASVFASAQDKMTRGAADAEKKAVTSAQRKAEQVSQIESRYAAKDYQERVRAESRKEKLAAQTAAREERIAERKAEQISRVESSYVARDYQNRVRAEARKEKLNEQAVSRDQRKAEQISDIESRYVARDYQQRVRAEARKERLAQQALEKEQRRAEQISDIEARYIAKDYQRRVQSEARKERLASQQVQKEERIAERKAAQIQKIEDRYFMRDMKRRQEFEQKQAEAAQEAADRRAQGARNLASGIEAVALAAGAALLRSSGEITQRLEDAADRLYEARRALREEGAVGGMTSDEALKASAKIRVTSGLDESSATNFARQYEGSLFVGLQNKNIDRGVADDLKQEAAVRAARLGGDAATHGELAGLLGQFGKVGSKEAGLAQLESIRIALTEGRGDDTPLTRQLLKASGSMVRGGMVGTLPEMAAMIGTMSLTAGPEESATRSEQVARALTAGLTKQSKRKGALMPQATYLKGMGISESTNLEERIMAVTGDLATAQAGGRELTSYLTERGFSSEEERRALIEMTQNRDVFKSRMIAARERAGATPQEMLQQGQAELAKNADYRQSATGKRNIGKAVQDVSKWVQGRPLEEFMAATEQMAGSKETAEGDVSTLTWLADQGRAIGHGEFGAEAGRKHRIQGSLIYEMDKRAIDLGIPLGRREELYGDAGRSDHPNAAYYKLISEEIRKRGGSTDLGVDKEVLDRLTKALDNNTDAQKQLAPAPGEQNPAIRGAPRAGVSTN